MSRYRNYCFTSYVDELKIATDPIVRYYVYQQEQCPMTNRKHWQGYIELFTPTRYNKVKEIVGDMKVHLEARKGTAKQASDYCKKKESGVPNTMVEWGEMAHQGNRIDIHTAIDQIRNGIENEDTDFYLFRYPGGYKALKERYSHTIRRDDIKLIYIYGEPGCGKSEDADKLAPEGYRMEDDKTLWMDNYKGEKDIIIDDFRGNLPINKMLRLCDKYRLQLPCKGGFVPIAATRIIFTSNFSPSQIYENDSQQEAWLDRFKRFGTIIYKEKIANYAGTKVQKLSG